MPGTLPEFAAAQQKRFDAATLAGERKRRGHFGTPPEIAAFMAELFAAAPREQLRILDPGAGVGTLSAAVCQRLIRDGGVQRAYLEAWETDPKLVPILEQTLTECRQAMQAAGRRLEFVVRQDDFILANAQRSLFDSGPQESFDWAILNPPYFKLRRDSPQARAMPHLVHGQPNIYALFLAVTADLLVPDGELAAITPRSWFNGPYFKKFRQRFFERVAIRQIHVFESRTEAFREDAVLQENVILHAAKGPANREIVLTASAGRDPFAATRTRVPYNQVLNDDGDCVVRVAPGNLEREIIEQIDGLPRRFRAGGYRISTGPVVSFRSTEFLRSERSDDTAPLLWMHNVRPFVTRFPARSRKPGHILADANSQKLLLPAKTYLLFKRFTAKEEKRRLVVGVVRATDAYSPWIGLENHLNYVCRAEGEFTELEALGLAAYFNSTLVDRYFRAISGNTQVNAAEIRAMPIPDIAQLIRLGEEIQAAGFEPQTVERVVAKVLKLSPLLTTRLVEAAQ